MGFLERISGGMKRYGEAFQLSGTTYYGVFKLLDSGTMHTYLDDVESMGVTRPGLTLVTDCNTPIAENNSIVRDGRTYTVLRVSVHRIAGVAVAKVAVLG
jgi:hypothetical protein